MATLDEIAMAFAAARARANIARDAERKLLHEAIDEAHRDGVSLRATAALLRSPVSTVASHWRAGHHCPDLLPIWGNEAEYVAAQREIWAHAPSNASIRSPYRWSDREDGSRCVVRVNT